MGFFFHYFYMQFLFPSVLFALSAISVPIIIHLFKFRRFKNVYFSNVAFLVSLQKEQKNKNKFKELLILLFRILLISALVFAFAQAYIPIQGLHLKSGRNAVSLYIDNSMSMENQTEEGNLLDHVKRSARNIIESYNDNDEFQIITNNTSSIQNRFFQKEQAINIINDIELTPFSKATENILELQYTSLKKIKAPNSIVYFLSDFQQQQSWSQIKKDTAVLHFLVPLKAQSYNNMYIDSAWFEYPILEINKALYLNVRIHNISEHNISDETLKLSLNDKQKAIANYSVASGGQTTIIIPFTVNKGGWYRGVLSIDDYPIHFDDQYYLTFYIRESLKILIISEKKSNKYLKTLFDTDDYFDCTYLYLEKTNLPELSDFDMIILSDIENISSGTVSSVTEYVKNSGNLILFPPESDKNTEPFNTLLRAFNARPYGTYLEKESDIREIALQNQVFQNIFDKIPENIKYPKIKKHYQRTGNDFFNEEALIILDNEDIFLSKITQSEGHVFVFSSALNEKWTELPKHSLFIPLLYKMTLLSGGFTPPSYFFNDKKVFTFKRTFFDEGSVHIITGDYSFTPNYNFVGNQCIIYPGYSFNKAGFYEAGSKDNPEKRIHFAINYDRKESEIQDIKNFVTQIDPKTDHWIDINKSSKKALKTMISSGKPLWKLFIWLALICVLAEILLIRFWKS
jgi:hypothetical protein